MILTATVGCHSGSPRIAAQHETRAQPSLEAALRRVVDRPEFRHSEFGIDILSLETGQHFWSLNAQKFFPSGSTAKLLTAATMSRFDREPRWEHRRSSVRHPLRPT